MKKLIPQQRGQWSSVNLLLIGDSGNRATLSIITRCWVINWNLFSLCLFSFFTTIFLLFSPPKALCSHELESGVYLFGTTPWISLFRPLNIFLIASGQNQSLALENLGRQFFDSKFLNAGAQKRLNPWPQCSLVRRETHKITRNKDQRESASRSQMK